MAARQVSLPWLQQPPIGAVASVGGILGDSIVYATTGAGYPIDSTVIGAKVVQTEQGLGVGFGATWGTGATDVLILPFSAHATQRVFAFDVYIEGHGSSGLGRVLDKNNGTQTELIYYASGNFHFGRVFSSAVGEWRFALAPGYYRIIISYDSSSAANDPVISVNGIVQALTETATPSGTAVTTTANYTLGNRQSGASRDINGWVGAFIFADCLLPLAEQHLALYNAFWGEWEPESTFTPIPSAGSAFTLSAAQGTYTLTGQTATLKAARVLTAAQGSYALSGQAAGLRADRKLVAAQGSYVLSGQAATLTYGGTSAALIADQGSYTLTGQAVGLLATRRLVVAQGTYTLTGQAAALKLGKVLGAAQGAYALSGQPATLRIGNRTLAAQMGAYLLTGLDAVLTYSAQQTPGRFGGFEMSSGRRVHQVHRKPLLRKILDERAEAKAVPVTLPSKDKRRRAKLIETIAAKVALEDAPNAEQRFQSLVDQWKALEPVAHGEPLQAAEAYRVFMAHVAQQVQRLQDEDDEEAIALLLL